MKAAIAAAIVVVAFAPSAQSQTSQLFDALPYLMSGGHPPHRPTPLLPTELEAFDQRVAVSRARLLNKVDETNEHVAWQAKLGTGYKATFATAAGVVLATTPAGWPIIAATVLTGGLGLYVDNVGDRFVGAAEALRTDTLDNMIASFLDDDFKDQIKAIKDRPAGEQARLLSEMIASAASLNAARQDPNVGQYLSRMIDLLQSELNGTNADDARQRATKLLPKLGRPQQTGAAAPLAKVAATQAAMSTLADAFGVPIVEVAIAMARAANAKPQDSKEAGLSLAAALRRTEGITSTVKSVLPAFAALGVDPQLIASVSETISKVESGMQLVAGAAAVYAGNAAGMISVVQGLGGIFGKKGNSSDGMAKLLRALEGRLIRIEQKIDQLIQAQRVTFEAIVRFELETRISLGRIERDIRLARQEIASSTGDLAFQGFRSCNATVDYLTQGAGPNQLTYGQLLAKVLRIHRQTIILPCLDAVRSLFASPNSLALSNPLLRDDRDFSQEALFAYNRRSMFLGAMEDALQGLPRRVVANSALRDFLFLGMFEGDTRKLAALWNIAATGNLRPPLDARHIQFSELSRPGRINPARLSSVTSTTLSVAPIYWFVDLNVDLLPDLRSNPYQIAKGIAVIENLSRLNLVALLDQAVAQEALFAPIMLEAYSQIVKEIEQTRKSFAELPSLRQAAEYSNNVEYEKAHKAHGILVEKQEKLRRALFRLEASISTNSVMARKFIEFAFFDVAEGPHHSKGDRISANIAAAELLLNGKVLHAGKRLYQSKSHKAADVRDLYWEILEKTPFGLQKDRKAFRTIYDISTCYPNSERPEVADWIKTDMDRVAIESFCEKIKMINAKELETEQQRRNRYVAFFAGLEVLPPGIGRHVQIRPETETLIGNYAASKKMMLVGKSRIAIDGKTASIIEP